MSDQVELLNVAAAWDKLSPEGQRAIGMSAIVLSLGSLGVLLDQDHEHRYEAAEREGILSLATQVGEFVIGGDPRQGNVAIPVPNLASIGIQSCRECGCTQNCACDEGCSWVEPDLCSACGIKWSATAREAANVD